MELPHKAALFVLAMGAEAAQAIARNLSPADLALLKEEMRACEAVSPEQMDELTREFYAFARRRAVLPVPWEQRWNTLHKHLSQALGQASAEALLNDLVKDNHPSGPRWRKAEDLAAALAPQHPHATAFILAHLGEPKLAQTTLEHLPEPAQSAVRQYVLRLRELS